MHSAKTATILFLLTLTASPTLALSQKQKPPSDDESPAHAEASKTAASVPKKPANKSRSQRLKHSPTPRKPIVAQLPPPPVSLVSASPEYLSGEANVTVKGNENPIIRLGLATSGVTLVEFPGSDRFFALHPGNSEMVTIDESPTKQNDHFFVFRAGSTFVPPPASHSSAGPAASIIAQMRSGMVVTFLIYPVRELSQMAHRIVILYDRAEVVAARRAAGLAVNLEEKQDERQERSIRIASQPNASTATEVISSGDSPEVRPRTVHNGHVNDASGDSTSGVKAPSTASSERTPLADPTPKPDRDLASEARKALKLAITSSSFKRWTRANHGLSIATSTPKEFNENDGSAIVIVAVSNILPEPLRIVPGQPDLSIETRDEQGKKTLLVEQIKPIHVESSGLGDSIPASATLYYAIIYRRPVLGVRQHLRVTVGQINAADDPAGADLTTSSR
jgi:hypothetical protein